MRTELLGLFVAAAMLVGCSPTPNPPPTGIRDIGPDGTTTVCGLSVPFAYEQSAGTDFYTFAAEDDIVIVRGTIANEYVDLNIDTISGLVKTNQVGGKNIMVPVDTASRVVRNVQALLMACSKTILKGGGGIVDIKMPPGNPNFDSQPGGVGRLRAKIERVLAIYKPPELSPASRPASSTTPINRASPHDNFHIARAG